MDLKICLIQLLAFSFVSCNEDPCSVEPCGSNAECETRGGSAVCTCPPGFSGDPFVACSELNVQGMLFNRSSRRKRGKASNSLFIICTRLFFCIFQTSLAMATLGLKEMEEFLWEGREYGGKRNGH